MRIVRWISDSMSIRGEAVIEVEPGEVADIDKMIALLDGEAGKKFGVYILMLPVPWHQERTTKPRQFRAHAYTD